MILFQLRIRWYIQKRVRLNSQRSSSKVAYSASQFSRHQGRYPKFVWIQRNLVEITYRTHLVDTWCQKSPQLNLMTPHDPQKSPPWPNMTTPGPTLPPMTPSPRPPPGGRGERREGGRGERKVGREGRRKGSGAGKGRIQDSLCLVRFVLVCVCVCVTLSYEIVHLIKL